MKPAAVDASIPPPRSADRPRLSPAGWLALGILLTAVGKALATWRGDGSSINAFLFLALRLSHEAAAMLERSAMAAVLILAVCGIIWPRWLLLVPVSLYFFAEALAGWHQGGYHFSEWSPLAHAPAYIAPIALALLASPRTPSPPPLRVATASCLLRLALTSLFLAHGLEAFLLHPRFIDLILGSVQSLLGLRVSEAAASTLLRLIGILDIALALAILFKPWRPILLWMAFWTALAAISRLTALGWGAYPDLLVRFTYITVPLALWSLLRTSPAPPEQAPAKADQIPVP